MILPADKNYSYADGDEYYQWSPDSKWLLVQFGLPDRIQVPQVGLVSADGKGEIHNLTESGYDSNTPKWVMDGKMMIWGSDRRGARQQGGELITADVYGMFFTRAAYDRFRLTKEEFALVKELLTLGHLNEFDRRSHKVFLRGYQVQPLDRTIEDHAVERDVHHEGVIESAARGVFGKTQTACGVGLRVAVHDESPHILLGKRRAKFMAVVVLPTPPF